MFIPFALCLAIAASSIAATPRETSKVVLISWDGAPNWVIRDMVRDGKLPGLSRIMADGFRTDGMQPTYPSKTAVGHASIFTGTWPDIHGVSNNSVPLLPRSENGPDKTIRGFDSAALQAEPLIVTAARQGKRVISLSSTQSYPADKWVKQLAPLGMDKKLSIYSGFESQISKNTMLDASRFKPVSLWKDVRHAGSNQPLGATADVGETRVELLLVDDPADNTNGFDTVLVRTGGSGIAQEVKPKTASDALSAWSKPIAVRKGEMAGNTFVRAFTLSPDASDVAILLRSANAIKGHSSSAEERDYLATYTGFHADAWFDFQDGLLGTPIYDGGTGDAEARAVELVRFDLSLLTRGLMHMATKYKPDLITHYTPQIDSAGHTLMAFLDPSLPGHDPKLAAKIRPFYEEVIELHDQWVGTAYDALSKDYAFIVVSDHGMEGTNRKVYINKILVDAGLAAVDAFGKLDTKRSKIFAPGWGEFGLVVNDTTWKGGIVLPGERAAVIEAATNALLAARDPQTGTQIIRGVFDSAQIRHLGLGGVNGQDVYLDFAKGYAPSSSMSKTVAATITDLGGNGVHGFLPLRDKMQAICYVGGKGVKARGELRGVRQIDIHPTVCELLGIAPSKFAIGRSLLH
ncbi:MAG: alkaline phosphatase family protein [Armatimonadota bacterium]